MSSPGQTLYHLRGVVDIARFSEQVIIDDDHGIRSQNQALLLCFGCDGAGFFKRQPLGLLLWALAVLGSFVHLGREYSKLISGLTQ